MHIGQSEKQHIARIISFFLSGEKVAHRCAARQAQICDDKNIKRFLRTQARQEKFHATVFQSEILWLAPKGVRCPAQKQMQQYEKILMASIDNNDLTSSIIGLQIILEGMGDIALSHFNDGIDQRGIAYKKIRNTILAQEDAHHLFGLRFIESNRVDSTQKSHAENYLPLINDMFKSLETYFEFFDEDSRSYLTEFNQNLPVWMQNNALNYYPNT